MKKFPKSSAGAFKPPELKIIPSPYRYVLNPLLEHIVEEAKKHPDRQIAVIIPEKVEKHLAKAAEQLLAQALIQRSGPPGTLTVAEFHAMLAALAEGAENLPDLPTGNVHPGKLLPGSTLDGRFPLLAGHQHSSRLDQAR